jgi:hypothetical protein
MNKHSFKGSTMNTAEMKLGRFLSGKAHKTLGLTTLWLSLVGVILICAPAQVAALDCDAEWQELVRLHAAAVAVSNAGDSRGEWTRNHPLISKELVDSYIKSHPRSEDKDLLIALKRERTEKLGWITQRPTNAYSIATIGAEIANNDYQICRFSNIGSTNRPSSTSPAVPNSPANTGPEGARMSNEVRDATALVQKRQAEVDRARQGKPKRHVAGAEAHQCLTLAKGGGVTNQCPYAVEYLYCVYRPSKDSWSAGLDCEKGKGGIWHIGPGPGSRGIMQSEGERTYWFACKYGATISKPDGIGVADTEFQTGRGILGRCAEWGSRQG